jgi:Protein of unknown function (DUF2934)
MFLQNMAHFSAKTHTPRTHLPRNEPQPSRTPSHEEIARLAYAYWEARGRRHGCPEEDWYSAEREAKRMLAP